MNKWKLCVDLRRMMSWSTLRSSSSEHLQVSKNWINLHLRSNVSFHGDHCILKENNSSIHQPRIYHTQQGSGSCRKILLWHLLDAVSLLLSAVLENSWPDAFNVATQGGVSTGSMLKSMLKLFELQGTDRNSIGITGSQKVVWLSCAMWRLRLVVECAPALKIFLSLHSEMLSQTLRFSFACVNCVTLRVLHVNVTCRIWSKLRTKFLAAAVIPLASAPQQT